MPNIYVENDVEGFGMVATETCAAGALAVAANIQGISDAIEDKVSGILYTPKKSEQLAKIIKDIYKNLERYEEIRQNAAQYVIKNFTGKAIAEKYQKIINQRSS